MDHFDYFFFLLERLEGVEQKEDNHPEKHVLNHSLQTFFHSVKETKDYELRLASLLHDVGKFENTLGHDQIGVDYLKGHVSEKVLFLVGEHIRIKWYLNGKMKRLQKTLYLAHHPWLRDLIQLSRWDMLGRNPNKKMKLDKALIVKTLVHSIL